MVIESTTTRAGARRTGRWSTGAPGPIRRELGPALIDELTTMCRPSSWWGAVDVGRDFVAVAVAIAIGVFTTGLPFHAVVVALVGLFVGLRQRWLANLSHELSHNKLFRSAKVNRVVGHMIATAMIESFQSYADDHRTHHAKLGRDGDPKLRSYAAKGATTPGRDRWSFVLRVVVANALWTLPVGTVKGWFTRPIDERWFITGMRATTWTALSAAALWIGTLDELAIYWLVPLAIVRPTANWLTDLGNHAGLIDNVDPILQTRGWTSHAVTRYLLGGHLDDMFHPVHHWCPLIPYRALPTATQILRDRYARFGEVAWCSGFFFRRRSTPGVPSVVEDIVNRLRPAA